MLIFSGTVIGSADCAVKHTKKRKIKLDSKLTR